ncbi:Glucose-6-phosphate 1-dehydrogenase [Geranomyces michiganensis]|nr:Glucose-6-phosphate 1-dehydrogenase [Geranomyces michiganensis]
MAPSSLPFDHVTIAVFGASGDLAKKMTYPAIYSLVANGMLDVGKLHVVGTARSSYKGSEFQDKIKAGLKEKKDAKTSVSDFLSRCSYVSLKGYEDAESYSGLDAAIRKLEPEGKKSLRLFYIALPPSAFEDVTGNIKKKCWPSSQTNRLIVEKPYGKDETSAKKLSKHLESLFTEDEIYRIDHYLGKDTVKTCLPLRFGGNPHLSATWSREHVSAVTVNFKEEFGAEGRGGYFDDFGMIRDVVQNHLMQWIVLLGMEPPKSLGADDIHEAKLKFISECRAVSPDDVLVAQYEASKSDKEKKAYRDDETVKDDSKAATFATAVMYVDNERWKGVPFVIRAGKALDETRAEVTLHFKTPAKALFPTAAPSTFTVRDHPEKSHTLTLSTKQVGEGFSVVSAPLVVDFDHADPKASIKASYVPTAYETLIYEAIAGDHTWFLPRAEAEAGWRVWDAAISGTENRTPFMYEYGGQGPKEEKAFLEQRAKGVRFETGEAVTEDFRKQFSALKL